MIMNPFEAFSRNASLRGNPAAWALAEDLTAAPADCGDEDLELLLTALTAHRRGPTVAQRIEAGDVAGLTRTQLGIVFRRWFKAGDWARVARSLRAVAANADDPRRHHLETVAAAVDPDGEADADDRDSREERASIMEYHGGLPCAEAERLAGLVEGAA